MNQDNYFYILEEEVVSAFSAFSSVTPAKDRVGIRHYLLCMCIVMSTIVASIWKGDNAHTYFISKSIQNSTADDNTQPGIGNIGENSNAHGAS